MTAVAPKPSACCTALHVAGVLRHVCTGHWWQPVEQTVAALRVVR